MKRIVFAVLFMLFGFGVQAQVYYAYRINPVASLPATCNPYNGEVVALTSAGPSGVIYSCTSLNTWTVLGLGPGSQLNVNQGTLTASLPFLNHTATWNNGAVTFVDDFRNVTSTASAAASLLAQWQVGGVNQFTVDEAGNLNTAGTVTATASVLAGSHLGFSGSESYFTSPGDGYIVMTEHTGTAFYALNLGPSAATNPRIAVSAPVGGQTQGIILLRGDGTAQVEANLGAATNGSMIYCSDCTIANPCAAGGTGAIAKRLNGVWVCN